MFGKTTARKDSDKTLRQTVTAKRRMGPPSTLCEPAEPV